MESDELTTTEELVIEELTDGRATPGALADWTGAAVSSVHNALGRLQAAGHVEKVHESALYELVDNPYDVDVDSNTETDTEPDG
jgi:DNA-binding IclR family transcriptional regulator